MTGKGRPSVVGAAGELGQERYFKYFTTDVNKIAVAVRDANSHCLLAHRDSARST